MIDSQLAQNLISIGTQITLIEQMNTSKTELINSGKDNSTVSADIYPLFYLYCHYNGTDEYLRQIEISISTNSCYHNIY